jgi:hypothetical protein
LRYDARKRRLTWKLSRTYELGVSRYPFGADGMAELRVEARIDAAERPHVTVTANEPLEVELIWSGGSEITRVGPLL